MAKAFKCDMCKCFIEGSPVYLEFLPSLDDKTRLARKYDLCGTCLHVIEKVIEGTDKRLWK